MKNFINNHMIFKNDTFAQLYAKSWISVESKLNHLVSLPIERICSSDYWKYFSLKDLKEAVRKSVVETKATTLKDF